jgi:nucleotide-binding universal stress UspA family protein
MIAPSCKEANMRTILLPLGGRNADRWTLEIGLDLAARYGSHLTALLPQPNVAPVPAYTGFSSTAGFITVLEHVRVDTEARAATTRELVDEVVRHRTEPIAREAGAGAPSLVFATDSGEDEEVVRRWAAVHDLLLFRRVSDEIGEPLPATPLFKNTLEYSGRPILLVTDSLPDDFGETIAVAWNGSAEGARAVTASLPLLARAGKVVILTVETGKTDGSEGERLRDYLARHGVAAAVDLRTATGEVGDALMLAAAEHGASLLVTGGYTHGRLHQSLFGGVTSHLLAYCRTPLLMAH